MGFSTTHCVKLATEALEAMLFDRIAHVVHQLQVVEQVVDRAEARMVSPVERDARASCAAEPPPGVSHGADRPLRLHNSQASPRVRRVPAASRRRPPRVTRRRARLASHSLEDARSPI